jgi:hypothetical protein
LLPTFITKTTNVCSQNWRPSAIDFWPSFEQDSSAAATPMMMVLLLGFWLVHASAIVTTAAAAAIPVGEVTATTVKSRTSPRVALLRDGPYMTTATTRTLAHQLQHQCVATADFPKCHAPSQPVDRQRLRREVRSLPSAEWDKVVRAMWTMKNISSIEAGKAQYGPGFRPYDYFVAKHAVATTDARGDQAHYGAHSSLGTRRSCSSLKMRY